MPIDVPEGGDSDDGVRYVEENYTLDMLVRDLKGYGLSKRGPTNESTDVTLRFATRTYAKRQGSIPVDADRSGGGFGALDIEFIRFADEI